VNRPLGSRLQRRVTAWLSLAAMLLITVAPAVPKVFDTSHCPPTGVVQLAMASEEVRHDTAHAATAAATDHCTMCLLFGAPFGLIRPHTPAVPDAPAAHATVAAPAPQMPVARLLRGPGQPRAPPGAA
jgi:hypothetical protein